MGLILSTDLAGLLLGEFSRRRLDRDRWDRDKSMNFYTDDKNAIAVVRAAFPDYHHSACKLQVREFHPIRPTSCWDSGHRDLWAIAKLDTSGASGWVRENGTAFTEDVGEITDIPDGTALVCLSQGGRETAILYVKPENVARLLPSIPTLTDDEMVVCVVTSNLKSFARAEKYKKNGLDNLRVESAKASLVAKGLLLKSGAITTEGRNAADSCPKKQNILWAY